jgi:uncharacterized repeat protein (TIGR03803 family)
MHPRWPSKRRTRAADRAKANHLARSRPRKHAFPHEHLLRLESLEQRVLLAITLQGIPTYESQGPGPILNAQSDVPRNEVVGAVNAVLPLDSNHVLIGTVNGGVWRTSNASADVPTWTPLTDQYPGLSINSLAGDGTTIYAGIGDDSSFQSDGGALTGILYSGDGGGSWQQLGNRLAAFPPSVNPTASAKGGALATGAYYLKYTYTNAAGESTPSLESAQFNVTLGNIPLVTLPPLPAGVTGFNIYMTPPNGAPGTEVLYGGSVGTVSLTGAVNPLNGTPPAISTLVVPGGGTAPDPAINGLGLAGVNVRRIIPTGLTVDGTPNTQVLLAGTDQGVFLSQDGGQTWRDESGRPGSNLPPGGVSDLVLAASQVGGGDVLYTAIPGAGVYSTVLAPGGEILVNGHFNPIIPSQAKLPLTWTDISAPLNGQSTPYQLNNVPVVTDVTKTNWIDLAVHDSTDGDFVWAALVQPTSSTATPFFGNQFVGIFGPGVTTAGNLVPWGLPSDSDGPVDPTGETGGNNGAIVADQESGDVAGGGPVLYIGGDGEAGNDHEGKVFRATAPNQWEGITGDQESPIDTDFGKPHADTRGLSMQGQYLYAATDGGIYQLNNARLDVNLANSDSDVPHWKSVNGSLRDTEFFSVGYDSVDDVVVGGTQDNGTDFQPSDGSGEWAQIQGGGGGGDGGFVAVKNVGSDSFWYFASDGLTTFTRADAGSVDGTQLQLLVVGQGNYPLSAIEKGNVPFAVPLVVDSIGGGAINQQHLLLAMNTNLYVSNDGGYSCFLIGPYAGGQTLSSSGGTVLIYGGRSGGQDYPEMILSGAGTKLYYRAQSSSPNENSSLALVTSYKGANIRGMVADRDNWKTVYIVDSNSNVWWTPDVTNNAQPFLPLTFNLPNLTSDPRTMEQVLGQDGKECLLIGGGKPTLVDGVPASGAASGGIYQLLTVNGQQTWLKFGGNLPNALVTDIHYDSTDDVLVVGTFGRGAFTIHHIGSQVGQPGVITVNGDDDPTHPNDNIVLSLDANNPLLLDVTLNGAAPVQVPATAVSQINVNGKTGADTLTVDFRNGVFALPGGIVYDGGGGGDSLVVYDNNVALGSTTYNASGPSNGTLAPDGVNIVFKNLTPVFVHNAWQFTLITPNSGNSLTLDTPAAGQIRISGTSGGVGFENATVDTTQHIMLDLATNDGPTESDTLTATADALRAVPNTDLTLHTGSNVAGNVLNLDARGHDVTITQNTIKVVGAQALFFDTLGTINLTNAGEVAVDGFAPSDSLVVNANSPTAGNLRLNDGPLVVFDTLSSLAFVGNGADSLVIHNPAGTIFAPSGGIQFESDAQAGFLTLDGGGGPAFVETDNNGPAAWAANVVFAGPVSTTIRLSGVLHISDTVAAGQFIVNATDAANSITLDDGAAPGDGLIRATIDSFPLIEFGGKMALLINGGLTAANLGDTIYVNYHELPTNLTSVVISSGSGNGVIHIVASPLVSTEIDTGDSNELIDVNRDFRVPITIVGGSGQDTIYGGAGNDIAVRRANLTIDDTFYSPASILTLTDSAIYGWTISGTGLKPVVHVDSLYSLTIDAAAGDRFDLEGGISPTINNASTTRDDVYDMGTGAVLNGDFDLSLGWRLIEDGTITKPESLQKLNAAVTVTFTSASSNATQVVFDGNLDPPGATYTIGNNKIGNLLFVNQTVGLTVEINGFRSQDQVTIDLPGGSVAADLRHTGPATLYLDGSVRLAGTNSAAADQFTVQARSGNVTMQPDGPNNSVFSLFNTVYLLGSMPQDSLGLTQTTNFKVAPTVAQPAAPSYGFELDDVAGFGTFVAGYATAYLQGDPPPGWVYNLHSPAPVLIPNGQLPDQDRLSYFYNIEDSPTTILDAAPLDYLADNVDYNDSPLTYAGGGYILRHDDSVAPNTGYYTVGPLTYGQLTVWERIVTVTSHPVPIDNVVNLDASQLRGSFNYTAADPNYDLLGELVGVFGVAAIAFGKTTVNLSGVNPQSAVTVSGQHELGFDYYQDAFLMMGGQEYFPGASFNSREIADNRIPTTSVNVGSGLLANIQGNVTVQQAQLTVDDGRGALPGIMTLTDTSLTGWTTALGATQPTLSFDTTLHDDFVITGSPVDQFDVENTPATLPAVQQSGLFGLLPTPVGLNQTLIHNLASSGTPPSVYVMGKALPRLTVTGNFALAIGRRVHADGTVDNVGRTDKVFYSRNTYSQPITFNYTGVGLGAVILDRSSESVYSGPSGIYANTDDAGHYYLKSDFANRSGLLNGDLVFAGSNTELFYDAEYDPQRTANFEIENTLTGAVHYVANPKASAAVVNIGAAFGPIDVQGSGANTRVTLDPTFYVNNGVAGSSLRDTVTADVSVTNATLRIVADSAAALTPQNPPAAVLTDSQLTGVAGGTVRFQNLADGVKVDPNFSGLINDFGLSLQLPRDAAISTLIQNTPPGTTTEITTADPAVAAGAVVVTGTTGTLWLGRDYPDSGFARSAFSVASVTIGGGSLDGISGPIALEYTSAAPTTIDDHANSTPTQGALSLGPASTDANKHFVGYYPLEFDTPRPIYLGYAFNNRTVPVPLDVLGAAQSHFTVTYSPVGTRLFAGPGGTVDVTTDPFGTAPSLAIFGAAAVHLHFNNYPDGNPITVEADPARPLDPSDLTVAYSDSSSPSAITLGAASNGFDLLTATYYAGAGQIFYEAATTHLTVSGGIAAPVTLTDTGTAGTTIAPDYAYVYVRFTDGPLTLSDGPATHLALGNAGSVQALHGKVDILGNDSAQSPLPVTVDDSADGTGRTIGVSLGDSGNTLISGLAPTLINVFDTRATIAIAGGAGGNLLVGPDIAHSWQITGADSGMVDANVSFTGVDSLQGGMADDTFAFQAAGSLSGHLDGGPGFNSLDYSAAGLNGSEPFDLAHNVAPRVAGPVTNIENATLILSPIGDQTSVIGTTILPLELHTLGGFVGHNALTFSASGLPKGLNIDAHSGSITGTIADQAAADSPYQVTIAATDGTNTALTTFQWTVSLDFSVVNPGNQFNNKDDIVSLPIQSTNLHGKSLQFTATGLPAGLTIDSATGVISGTIQASQAILDPVSVTVSDGVNTLTAQFTWTVSVQRVISVLTLDQANDPINQVQADQRFNLQFDVHIGHDLDTTYYGYLYLFAYGYVYVYAGVGEIYGYSLTSPGNQTLTFYDFVDARYGTFTITVEPLPPLKGVGVDIQATTNIPFTGLVASFTDTNLGDQASDFTANIDWGDGATTSGTVTANTTGGFDVTGTQIYAAVGSYPIDVTVSDSLGDVLDIAGESAVVMAPVAMTAPADSSFTNNNEPTLAAITSGGTYSVQFEYSADGGATWSNVGDVETVAPFSFSFTRPLPDGAYAARAIATDSAGHTFSAAPVSFTLDTVSPAVSLTTPADGSLGKNNVPTFSGTSGAASGDYSTITINVYSGADTTGPLYETLSATATGDGSYSAPSSQLGDGTYTAQASQTDLAGNVGYSTVTFTIDTMPPSVSVAVALKGAQPTFSARATDNPGGSGLASVQFQYSADGGATWVNAGPAETAAPFSYAVSAGLPDGTYLARAGATDNAGNSAVAAASLVTLASLKDGSSNGGLISDSNGNLYGTTYNGGANGEGTVFELNPTTSALTTLYTFAGPDGAYPYLAGLTINSSGNLYGTTSTGGAGYGTVFELDPNTGLLSTLVSFDGVHGAYPYCSLTMDSSGDLYGTTYSGGANSAGTVFELNPSTGQLRTLASFDVTDGAYPYSGLIADAGGDLYGTTSQGGANENDQGTVFELTLSTGALTTLATFDGPNGAYPYAGLIADANGNLYGTTYQGGANSEGTVFELTSSTGALTTLATCDGPNGAYPYAGLIADASGDLYGTTYGDSTDNQGTVFELNPATGVLNTLVEFNGADGASPSAGLVMDAGGNLYGTTTYGGSNNAGTIFELSPATFTIKSLLPTTISVSSVTTPYDGRPHGATAEVYGPGNLDLGPATISYPGGLVPVEVGTYSVTASFTGTNRYAADTITIPNAITITQDTPTVTATSDNTTYNGSPEAYPDSDVTVTGANHLNNSGGTLTYTYNGSATVPTTAGTYAVLATFKPSDTTDYAIVTGTATWTIKSAPPVAHDDVYSASSLTETDIGAAAGVLFNDADASGDRLTAVLDSATRHGTLTLHADGSFSYVPFSGYVGDDRFSYHTADGALVSGEAVVTIHVYAPAQVTQVAVNSDATQVQRSQILNLQVSFSELVDLGSTPAAAFQLVGPDGQQVNLVVVITTNAAGGTVATLTFLSGPDTFKLATGQFALVDGRYQLTVLKDSVHDANGHSMDADTIDKFFRLFGDARGTGLVDNGDLTLFRKAYNTASSSANYRWYFDENMDGRIDSVDLSAFQSDYYKKV